MNRNVLINIIHKSTKLEITQTSISRKQLVECALYLHRAVTVHLEDAPNDPQLLVFIPLCSMSLTCTRASLCEVVWFTKPGYNTCHLHLAFLDQPRWGKPVEPPDESNHSRLSGYNLRGVLSQDHLLSLSQIPDPYHQNRCLLLSKLWGSLLHSNR